MNDDFVSKNEKYLKERIFQYHLEALLKFGMEGGMDGGMDCGMDGRMDGGWTLGGRYQEKR